MAIGLDRHTISQEVNASLLPWPAASVDAYRLLFCLAQYSNADKGKPLSPYLKSQTTTTIIH